MVRMASYLGPTGAEGLRQPESEYFEKREGGMSWSIGIEGRFLNDEQEGFNADEIVFGNVWEKPIRFVFRPFFEFCLGSVEIDDEKLGIICRMGRARDSNLFIISIPL